MPGKLIVDEIEDSGGTSVIGRKNYLINGNFDIWQRGTSLTGQTASNFLADRWEAIPSGATYSYQQGTFTVGQTDVPNNPKYFANYTITGADDAFRFQQAIEDVNTLAGETITISFWAKYTTNAPTNFLTVVSQNFGSGGSTEVSTTFASGQTLTTSWQKFTVTGTLPSISGKTVGTSSYVHIKPFYNTNNEIFDVQIAQVQVEKGSVATDFEILSLQETKALCERFFQIYIEGTQEIMTGAMYNSTTLLGTAHFPMMRGNPTVVVTTGTAYYRFWRNGGGDDFSEFNSIGSKSPHTMRLQNSTGLSGTAGHGGTVTGYNANAKITLDAEL
jgi:hypothetical protein